MGCTSRMQRYGVVTAIDTGADTGVAVLGHSRLVGLVVVRMR